MAKSATLSNKQKIEIVIKKNTFFFRNQNFEDEWEGRVSAITKLLLSLQRELKAKKTSGAKKKIVVDLLLSKSDGLASILALTAVSEELLLRLVTFARTVKDKELATLVNIKSFAAFSTDKEVNKASLFKLIKKNKNLAESIVNLLFDGYSVPILRQSLPLFELKKLNFGKLDFTTEGLLDSLVRFARKGSYSALDANDPAGSLKQLLKENKIPFNQKVKVTGVSRTMDFAIPNKEDPKILIECSFEVTTSSAMGDKAKTEIQVISDIKRHYSNTTFIGFVDGIGWYVRKRDLARLVGAFDNVFTFKESELKRFLEYVNAIL